MPLLIEFVFRLGFGLALAMSFTSPARVTSGFFRNHLYVLLGINVLATLASLAEPERFVLWPPLAAAAVSYVGAVAWLYEKPRLGGVALVLVSALDLIGAWLSPAPSSDTSPASVLLRVLDPASGGLLLGSTIAAMFLGHWYLNTPGMELAPLRRLMKLVAASLSLRVTVAAAGLAAIATYGDIALLNAPLLTLRWLAGLVGMAVVVWMTWQTIKIPNTQSATGILYVGVILSFLGELVSLLLSQDSSFPV
jgi:hypothetical protein